MGDSMPVILLLPCYLIIMSFALLALYFFQGRRRLNADGGIEMWMRSIHESVNWLSMMINGISKDGVIPPKEDGCLCNKKVAYILKASHRTSSESKANGPCLIIFSATKSCTKEILSLLCE